MINESNQNHTYLNLDEDPSLNLRVPQVNSLGIPTPKTRKQWYQTNSPRIRSYITGNFTPNISGKGAKSLQRAADEYQHLSEEFARRGYSSKAMSRKYDNFNGIDSSLLDLALENENNKLNTYQDQFNSEKINERQFNRLQQTQQRRINNLNDNYSTLAEISANKRGIPLVRTQSSVSPAPFVLGTAGLVGAPLLLAGMVSGGVAAAPYITKAAPYIAKAMSNPWVIRTTTGLDVVDTGVSLAGGNYLGAAANWIPYDKVLKAGKRAVNAGRNLLKVGASKVSDLGKMGKHLLSNTPKTHLSSSDNVLDQIHLSDSDNMLDYITPQGSTQIQNNLPITPSPRVGNGDLIDDVTPNDLPPVYNPKASNLPPVYNPKASTGDSRLPYLLSHNAPTTELRHKKIIDMPNQSGDIKVNDALTKDFLEFVNSSPASAGGTFVDPFAKQFYINNGINPDALTPEVMAKAEDIAQKSAMDAFQGVEGTIAYPSDANTVLYYFRNGPNKNFANGDPTGRFTVHTAAYRTKDGIPIMDAYHSDFIGSLKPDERGVSEALYNSAIKYGKLRGHSRGVVTGEYLLSPEQTTKVWNRFKGKTLVGKYGIHRYGNGSLVDGSRVRPTLIRGRDGTMWFTKGYTVDNQPVYLLHQPTYDLPIKVGNVLDPTRIVRKNGKLELTPLNLKSNDLYKVLAPITGGAGMYYTFGNNNNQ